MASSSTISTTAVKPIGIVAKPGNELAHTLIKRIIAWCNDRSLTVTVETAVAEELDKALQKRVSVVQRDQISTVASPIIVLGGDGTLISASRHPAEPPPVLIGVNLGTLGFLTEITAEELFPTLELYLAGQSMLVTRPLLSAVIKRAPGKTDRASAANADTPGSAEPEIFYALNDIVLTKEALARIFGVNVWVNRDHAALVRGDGVIVSTPCGSTAYSLSAGGSIVHPRVDALLVTPICPHSLTFRPLILPGNCTIRLEVAEDPRHSQEGVYLTIDGQEGMELSAGDQVTITTSPHTVRFVKSPSKNYFQVLGTKLKWAAN